MIDAAIVGAGPNGLSVAAHLRARGVGFRIFGEPMKTWLPMPRNLSLKSLGFATSIALPEEGATLPGWLAERNLETLEPISYADFTEYGLSVQRRFVPEVEPVNVTMLEPGPEGAHALTLATGERVQARSVVVAIGLNYLQRKPAELSDLPAELVSHTFGEYDFSAYAGKAVAVIGAGQSALEAAVLLHEAEARPVLISREPPFFYERTPVERSLLDRVRNPLTVFGAGRMHWVLEHFPGLLRHAPEQKRVRVTQRYLGPSGAWWLRDRFEGKVRVASPVRLLSAREEGGEVVLRLRHGAGGDREERVAGEVAREPRHLLELDREPGRHGGEAHLGADGMESRLVEQLHQRGHRRLKEKEVLAEGAGARGEQPGQVIRGGVEEMSGFPLAKPEEPFQEWLEHSRFGAAHEAVRVARPAGGREQLGARHGHPHPGGAQRTHCRQGAPVGRHGEKARRPRIAGGQDSETYHSTGLTHRGARA